jgi:hypothetical protein
MSRSTIPFFLVIIALAAMSLPVLAKPNTNLAIKATIDINAAMKVGSTTIAPGHYDLLVEGNQAKFEKDHKTVAEAPCTLKDLSSKAQQTEFQLNHDQLTEIQISGKTQAIEFSTD